MSAEFSVMFAPVTIIRLDNGYYVSIATKDGAQLVFNALGDRYGSTYDEGGKPVPSVIDWIHEYFTRTV